MTSPELSGVLYDTDFHKYQVSPPHLQNTLTPCIGKKNIEKSTDLFRGNQFSVPYNLEPYTNFSNINSKLAVILIFIIFFMLII